MADLLDRVAPLVNSDQFNDLDDVGKSDFREKAFQLFLSENPDKAQTFGQLPDVQQQFVRNKFVDQMNQRFPSKFTTDGYVYTDNGGELRPMATKVPIMDPATERFLDHVAPYVDTDNPIEAHNRVNPNAQPLLDSLNSSDQPTRDGVSALVRSRFGDLATGFDIPKSITVPAGVGPTPGNPFLPMDPSNWPRAIPAAVRTAGAVGVPAAAGMASDGLSLPASSMLGAAGAAAAEPFAQYLEKNVFHTRGGYSAADAGVSIAFGAIPGAGSNPEASLLRQTLTHGAVGGVVGGGQEAAHELVDQGTLNPKAVAQAAGAGALIGGTIGGAFKLFAEGKQTSAWMDARNQFEDYARQNGYTGETDAQLRAWGVGHFGVDPGTGQAPVAPPAEKNVTPAAEPSPTAPPTGAPAGESSPPAPAEAQPAVVTPLNEPDEEEAPPAPSEFTVKTPDESKTQVRGNWRIVDAGDVKTSQDDGYDQSLQPRDRSRGASQQQIASIAGHLDPELLGDSVTSDQGAPIINDRGMVLSGNGRTEAIRQAYGSEQGADAYKQNLIENSEAYGADPAEVEAMDRPMLVRQVSDLGGLEEADFARRSNRSQVLGMSDGEKAGADGQMLVQNPDLLGKFHPSEDGDVLAATNRDFLNNFVEATGDKAELLSKDGQGYNPKLGSRVRNAVLAAVVGPENRSLVSSMLEDNEGVRRVTNGLLSTASGLLRLQGTDYDLGRSLAKALTDLSSLRQSGESVDNFLAQQGLFGDPDRNAESDFILQQLAAAKSAKAVSDFLGRYSELAWKIDTTTPDMFGASNATRSDILRTAATVPRSASEGQADLSLAEPSKGAAKSHAAVRDSLAGGEGQGDAGHQAAGGAAGDVDLASAPVWDRRRDTKEWLADNVRGKPITNTATGKPIDVGTSGITKATSGDRDFPLDQLEALRDLPGILERAKLVGSHADVKQQGFTAIHHFEAPVTAGGQDYTARITVRERDGRNQFYDLKLQKKAAVDNSSPGEQVAKPTEPGSGRQPQGEEVEAAAPSQAAGKSPSDVPPSTATGGELGDPHAPVNDRSFSQLPIELPEMVQLGKALLGGQYPKVLQSLRALRGSALGVFKVREGVPSIELRADIFDLVQPAEKRILKEQAVEYAKAAKTADASVDEAAVARDRYEHLLTEAYDKAKMANPVLASKVLAHEIGHLDSWLPAHAMPKGSIFAHIAALKKYTKGMLSNMPPADGDLFTPADHARFKRMAERMTGPEPADDAEKPGWREAVAANKARMLALEKKARGLVSLPELKNELRPLIAWWRGTPTMEPYFEPPEEMYAEAFSVMLNNPAALEKRAPLFTRLFFNYLSEHPETQVLYGQIQNQIKSGAIAHQRVMDLREGFRAADQAGIERDQLGAHRSWPEITDDIRAAVDSTFAPVYRRLKANPDKTATDPVEQALSDYLYRTSAHELFLRHLNNRVLGPLHAANLEWNDLGEYMFHLHVINNRANIANSQGWNAKASRERLVEMSNELGAERFKTLIDAQKAYRAIYENEVIAPLAGARVLDPKLLKVIEDRSFYATMSAKRGVDGMNVDTVEAALINRYGADIGPKIYRQVGYLGDVKNPATATAKKAVSLISMTYREVAKRQVIQYLMQNDPMAREADMRWTGHGRQPIEVQNDRLGTLMYLDQGKLRAFYVPRAVADMFRNKDDAGDRISASMGRVANVVKALFTHWNPGFLPVLAARNAIAFRYQMPGGGYFLGKSALVNPADLVMPGRKTLLGESLKAARDLANNRPNSTADAALLRKMVSTRVQRYRLSPEDDAFEQIVKQYGLEPHSWEGKVLAPADKAMKLWLGFQAMASTIDRTFRIAGMVALDRNYQDKSEAAKRTIVQERAGGAKYRDAGRYAGAIEAALPFFNALKQHARAAWHSAKDPDANMWWKFALGAGGVGLALWLAENHYLDKEKHGKELGDMLRSIPEYDKSNYSCIPLGWTNANEKKVLYLRLPLIEPQRLANQFLRGTLQKLHGDKMTVRPSPFTFAAEQTPGLNPLIGVGTAWYQYKVEGHNPYDAFRGTPLIPQNEFEASRGQLLARADEELLKYSANQLGAGMIGRFQNPSLYSTDGGGVDQFLREPVVSNLVGRWLKVSNAGAFEAPNEASAGYDQQQAQLHLVGDDIVRSWNNHQQMTDAEKSLMASEPDLVKYVASKYAGVAAQQGQSPEVQALLRARSQGQKAAVAGVAQ